MDIDFQLKTYLAHYHRMHHPPDRLWKAITYSLLAPGKRIRPQLVLEMSQIVGLSSAAANIVALTLEMIHCFSLIHDDLPCMDNDDYRRGQLSNHKVHGEAMALLAGDSLIGLALDCYSNAKGHVTQERWVHGFDILVQVLGPSGIIGGQALELETVCESGSLTLDKLFEISNLKTAKLFLACVKIPLLLSDSPRMTSHHLVIIEEFGTSLGIAFQLLDDLQDQSQEILRFLSTDQLKVRAFEKLNSSWVKLESLFGNEADSLESLLKPLFHQCRREAENTVIGGTPK